MRQDYCRSRTVVAPRAVARGLRHPVRRAVLAVVLERDEPVRREELAHVVDQRCEAFGGGRRSDRSLRTALGHRHLPVLAGVDLVSRTPSGVVPGNNRLLAWPGFDAETLRQDGADWRALGAIFGQPRRRLAVSILADADLPLSLAVLARAVAAERAGDLAPDAPVIDDLEVRFHHVDLPMLADAGVVTYDAGENRVTAVSEPVLPVPVPGV